MDVGYRSPLADLFRRGGVTIEVRHQAARGALSSDLVEQLALMAWLADDEDAEVRELARGTLSRIPPEALAGFLDRPGVPAAMRDYFGALGAGEPAPGARREAADGTAASPAGDEPAGEPESAPGGAPGEEAPPDPASEDTLGAAQRIAQMNVSERIKAAATGTREERGILIRDPNRIVAQAVLSSPKLTESEIESFARMTNVSEDVLRVIGSSRQWVKTYGVVAGLVRNPKTPIAVSLSLMGRLSSRDVKALSIDRNVPEALRLAARKAVVNSEARKQ